MQSSGCMGAEGGAALSNPNSNARAESGTGGKILGLDRNVFFVGLTSFLTDTTGKMVYSVMPLFLLSIGATKTQLSLIEGIAESTASLLKAASGWLSDRMGRNKPFMVVGYAFSALLFPLFAIAKAPFDVLAIRFAERIGKGIRTAPRDSLVAASSGEGNRGRSFGFHKAMDNSGAIVGPLLAAGLLAAFPEQYRKVFLISGLPAVFGLLSIIAFVHEARRPKEERLGRISLRDLPARFYSFLGIIFVFTLGNSTDALLLVKASDVGIADSYIPVVYLVFNSVSVLFSVPAGILSDRIGREKLIIFGYLLYSLVYFLFGRAGSPAAVVILFALYGLYSASTDGIQKALVTDISDSRAKGTCLGIYNFLVGITLLPASLIAGILYDRAGGGAPFYFGSVMAFVAAMLMLAFYAAGKKQGRRLEKAESQSRVPADCNRKDQHNISMNLAAEKGLPTGANADAPAVRNLLP